MANFVHGLGQQLADVGVVARDRGDVLDIGVTLDGNRQFLDLVHHRPRARIDAALEQHRIGTGRQVAQAFGDDRLGQHGRGGGPVAGHVVGFGGGLLQHLRAHVLEVVLQFDFFGHCHPIVRDRWSAPLLIDGHVSTTWAKSDLDGIRKRVDASLELSTCLGVEDELLCRHDVPLFLSVGHDGQQVALTDDEVLVSIQLDFSARVLGEEHRIADLDVHLDALAAVEHPAGPDRQDRTLLGLLACCIRQDDTAGGHLVLGLRLDDDSVAEWFECDRHRRCPSHQLGRDPVRVGASIDSYQPLTAGFRVTASSSLSVPRS